MKKGISLFLVSVLIMGLFTACGKALKVDENTVYVQKKGKITGAVVEKFDKDYYDATELEEYVKERVETFTADNDKKSVSLDKFSVEDGVATLNIKYAGHDEYAKFNEVTMFVGTIPEAMAAGYEFDMDFTAVEKGEAKDTVKGSEIKELEDLNVIVLSEKVDVKVDGTIRYISSENTSMVSKDTVSIDLPKDAKDGDELALTYIVY